MYRYMNERKCTICQETKPASDFYKSGKYLYSHCKVCKRGKDKNTYHSDEYERVSRCARDKKSHRIRQLKAQIFAYGILSKSKCIDCGESRLETLDFDHVRGVKERNISLMVLKGHDVIDIKDEISKCDIRCSNCHRIKTCKELGWARSMWNIDAAQVELAKRIEQAPKRKPAPKRRSKLNHGAK